MFFGRTGLLYTVFFGARTLEDAEERRSARRPHTTYGSDFENLLEVTDWVHTHSAGKQVTVIIQLRRL